jgi:hypothetical protein
LVVFLKGLFRFCHLSFSYVQTSPVDEIKVKWFELTPKATVGFMVIIFMLGGMLGYLWGYTNTNVKTNNLYYDLLDVCENAAKGDKDSIELYTTLKKHKALLGSRRITDPQTYKGIIERIEDSEEDVFNEFKSK